jgi:HSP20 family protein
MTLIPSDSLFDIDRFLGDSWPMGARSEVSEFFTPRVDVKDLKDHYLITAELPGVSRDDINVQVENGVLTLEAQAHHEDKEEKEGRIIRQERRYGRFMRSFRLGSEVKESDIEASFKNGVLKLEAKKVAPKKAQAHRITIQ